MHTFTLVMFTFAILISISLGANVLHFHSLDGRDRFGCWYPGAKEWSDPAHPVYYQTIPGNFIPGHGYSRVEFEQGWQGSFRTIFPGQNCATRAVRGEIKFQGNRGRTWYDVSAVDNANDNSGVHWMMTRNWPHFPMSGCVRFPCNNVFNFPGDNKQVRDTGDTELDVYLGPA